MEDLKNIAPELSKIKKENSFGTPDNYFDDFSARMQMKLEAEKTPVVKKEFRIINILKPALGLAASFAIIVLLVYVPINTFMNKEQVNNQVASIEYSETDMQSILNEIDENSFFAMLHEEETTSDDFTDEELQLYVSANFTDYEIYEFTEN